MLQLYLTRGVTGIFDIKDISEDKLFNLIRTVDMDFMEIAFIDRNEGFIDGFHVHNWFDISFIMKGSVTYEIDGKIYEVSEGEVVIVGPGKYHKEVCSPETQFEVLFVCVHFTKDGKAFDIASYLNIPEVTKISDLKEIYDIFNCILNEVTYREDGYLLKINAQVYNLLVALCRNKDGANKGIDSIKKINDLRKNKITGDIKEYLEANYNKRISLNELSKIFFLSPQYISSLFKKQTGYSPVEYLNKIRITRAKEMLMAGEDNVGKVAEEVGISDIHYFYKVFRQFEKKTPVQFIVKQED